VISRLRIQSFWLLAFLTLSGARPVLSLPIGGSLGKIKEIRVTGLKRYTQPEVLPVSGLSVGQNVTEDDLKEATNVLARTGAFSNLAYSYSTMAGTVKVTLDFQETDKLLAIRLDNFVWWSDDELKAKLRARVPLYRDQLPMAGSLPDSVADGLQALLSERQLPGHVTYTRFAPEGRPLEAFVYHVEDISVRIRSVDFPGAGPNETPDLEASVQKQLLGKQYSAAQVSLIADVDFRNVYQRRGYLQVQFGAPATTAPDTAKPAPTPGDPSQPDPAANPDANIVRVDVHLPVQPGLQFHLATVDWTGNHAFPTDTLQKFIGIAPGALADLPALREGLDAMTKLYGTKGYMNVQHTLTPHLDTAAKTAGFTIKISEGDVYHFGELTIEGVDSKTAARLRERWGLRPGEPFDTSYEMKFMKETQTLLPQGGWSSADMHLDESDKTVDVVLRYTPTSIN